MDGPRFDAMVRALGAGGTRRGFVGLMAALAAGGGVADAGARKRRRRCRPACGPQQSCVDRQCTCPGGGTVCGPNCCLIGQECQSGQCVALPEPGECIAYGEPCKNAGEPCCENLVCASGQGGEADVACYVRKTGRCASTAECVYGTTCVDGICVAPVPPPPGPICNVQLGEPCVPADVCCTGECANTRPTGLRGREAFHCCVSLGEACQKDDDCCDSTPCRQSDGICAPPV